MKTGLLAAAYVAVLSVPGRCSDGCGRNWKARLPQWLPGLSCVLRVNGTRIRVVKETMDVFLRTVAILIEILILSTIMFALLMAVRLTVFDLGLRPKYKKIVTVALVTAGVLSLVFFVAHLTTFYPTVPG